MYGAIIGDIVGSKYEFNNIKTKEFPFLSDGCSYTDDTIMTIAVARALMNANGKHTEFYNTLIEEMKTLGRKYPHPQGGYGGRFEQWILSNNPSPYNSFGNGSAMRVSPCAIYAVELQEALELAEISASVTHNHPEGIKGAKATAAAIFMAKTCKSKDEIRKYISDKFYPLDKTVDEIRKSYEFNETCQDTVPQAIIAFLESESFEDAIRNAVSLGGDTDTLAAITGSIAWVYYSKEDCDSGKFNFPIDLSHIETINSILPSEFVDTLNEFEKRCVARQGWYNRITGQY
ncbi:MAG: ADP-ribosylglycohydrolase family protein [Clostridia bacterium]|nr:ADP-ribosylglycohydrolase family protein [Clostridia bacterium]